VTLAFGPFAQAPAGARGQLAEFIYDRFSGLLREQGYSAQEVDAVLALNPQRLADIGERLKAVRAFAALPEASSLAAANKRVGNILKKSDGAGAGVDPALLAEAAEQALAAALAEVGGQADRAYAAGEYARALRLLAGLKPSVDAFFDNVMVNVDSAPLRANRLALLAALRTTMNRVADLSRLAV
jgi:glycyl-tRNA synthetase beta chain